MYKFLPLHHLESPFCLVVRVEKPGFVQGCKSFFFGFKQRRALLGIAANGCGYFVGSTTWAFFFITET
jgi:hypothetical protein